MHSYSSLFCAVQIVFLMLKIRRINDNKQAGGELFRLPAYCSISPILCLQFVCEEGEGERGEGGGLFAKHSITHLLAGWLPVNKSEL